MSPQTLLLLPGLGVDARVYEPQSPLPLKLEVAEWIEPESHSESLAHYAERMADRIGLRAHSFVGGISLGAVVALEVATRINAAGVIAIGGCTSHGQIAPLFRGLLKAGAAAPARVARLSLHAAPIALKLFEKLDIPQRRLMTTMLREHSIRQTQWSCRALLEWECCAAPPTMPIHAIHGELDEVIPVAGIQVQHLVPGGRHLINLTHAAEVNRFILSTISPIAAP